MRGAAEQGGIPLPGPRGALAAPAGSSEAPRGGAGAGAVDTTVRAASDTSLPREEA